MKHEAGRRLALAASGLVLAVGGATSGVAIGAEQPPAPHSEGATALEQASTACAAPRPSAAPLAVPFTAELLYATPLLALDRACRQLADAPTADTATLFDLMLDIAESALRAGRLDAAQRLVEALRRDADRQGSGIAGDRLARLHLARGTLANVRAETPLAQRHFARARAALRSADLGGTLREVAVWVGEATAWRHELSPGGLDRAAEALDQATLRLAEQGKMVSLDMGPVLNERTMLAYARLDLAGTVDAARAEVALYRQIGLGDSAAPLDALVTLGGVLSQLGRHDEAESELREAVRLVDLHPGEQPAAALGVLNNAAALQLDRGRFAEALATADRAVSLSNSAFGVGSARTVTPLTVRGQALNGLGRYGEARRTFEDALAVTAVHAADVGPLRRLRLRETFATTLTALGETAAAEALIAEGLRETSALEGLDYWRGRLLRRRAAMAARRDDWPAADEAIAEAIARIGAVIGAHTPYVIDMESLRCFAQTQGRLPGQACADLADALPRLDTAAPGYRFNAMAALAQDDENHGRPVVALKRRLQALAAAESAATPDPLWSAYAVLAVQIHAQGGRQLAVLLGKQAVEQIERMRDSLDADQKRDLRGFLADKLVVYRRLADWLTEDGRIDEALDVIRLLKEEEFYDFTNRDGSLFGRIGRGPAYAEAEALLRRHWRAAHNADGRSTEALRRENERVAQRLGQLAIASNPGLASAPPTAPPPDSRAPPSAGEARVWIYPGEQRLHLVIDGPSRRSTTTIEVPPVEIAKHVAELLAAIESREPVLDRLQALHAAIGVPIERALAAEDTTRRVVLTVDGPLRYLPFAALHDGHGFFGEHYSVEQRVPAPGAIEAATAPLQRSPLHVEAMGTSRALSGMLPLREVVNEVCGIVSGTVRGLDQEIPPCTGMPRGVVGGSGWMNREFTADRLRTVIANARDGRDETRLLHISTHFVLRPGRMSRSWLLLGNGRPLSLEDIARFDLHGQSLVTLSACETGMGGAEGGGSGEEVEGLGGLMLRRGASGVVASLWRVNDASTSHLMQAFYRHLASGLGPSEALQRAQAQLRDGGGREAHPFYWAGFYLGTGAH